MTDEEIKKRRKKLRNRSRFLGNEPAHIPWRSMGGGGGNVYNPLINYTWSTQVTDGVMELVDSGTTPKYPAELHSGQGVLFNGVDQSIPIDDIETGTVGSLSFTSSGTYGRVFCNSINYGTYLSIATTAVILRLSNTTITFPFDNSSGDVFFCNINVGSTESSLYINGNLIDTQTHSIIGSTVPINSIGKLVTQYHSGTLKDLYIFNDTLTPTEISKYSSNPNGFFQDVQDGVIDNCVLNMPLDGTDATVHDYANNTDYTIANYTTSARDTTSTLSYGTQELNFTRNGLWRGDLSKYYEMDGTQVPAINVPMRDTDLGSKFAIEFVISREEVARAYLLFATDYSDGLHIRTSEDAVNKILLLRTYSSASASTVSYIMPDNEYHHIIVEADGTNLIMIVDGNVHQTVALVYTPSGLNFADSAQVSPKGILAMFKIWDEDKFTNVYDRDKSVALGAKKVIEAQGA